MRIAYRHQGTVVHGDVEGIAGAGLLVTAFKSAKYTLGSSRSRLVMIDDAVDRSQWMQAYAAFGGEALYDEDGDLIWHGS